MLCKDTACVLTECLVSSGGGGALREAPEAGVAALARDPRPEPPLRLRYLHVPVRRPVLLPPRRA